MNKSQASAGLNSGMSTGYMSWKLPTPDNNTYESKTKMGNEMIHVGKDQLFTLCNWTSWNVTKHECMLIFSVLPSFNETEAPS
jgi:hypothetical protein